jgi:hypothetical protein
LRPPHAATGRRWTGAAMRRAIIVGAALVFALSAAPPASRRQTPIGQPSTSVTTERGGWATVGVVLPKGAASAALRIENYPTQTDVKVRWPDGSIRHALLTAKLPKAGTYAVVTAARAAAAGSPPASSAACSAEITIAGNEYVAAPSGPPGSVWLTGAQVTDARWLTPFGRHRSRKLRLDQRTYADGAVKCDFSIENALNVAETDQEQYNVVLKYRGAAVYARNAVVHGSFARWRYVFWQGGQDDNGTADLRSFVEARAIARYLPDLERDNRVVPPEKPSGTAWEIPPEGFDRTTGKKLTSWDILNIGDMHYPMWDYGGREDIGPYPEWVAQFVAFHGVRERAYMLRIGDLAGSWANHVTETDDRVPSVERKPEFWLLRFNAPTNGSNGPANNQRGIRPENDKNHLHGAWRPEIGNAHQPSLAYVPYLVTGDRYYCDEMRFWANDAVISWNPVLDGQALSINDDEIRGTAWGLRDLVDAATYLPDQDGDKTYFEHVVDATVADIQRDAQARDVTGVGAIMLGRSAPDRSHMAPTTQMFLAWSLSHAADQGVKNATGVALDRLTRPVINLLLHPGAYPLRYVPSWSRWVLRGDQSAFKKADGSPDFAAVWRYNFAGCTPAHPDDGTSTCKDPVDGHLVSGVDPWFGWHAAEMYPGLIGARTYGVANAGEALTALLGHTERATWGETLTMHWELARRSQWAIAESPVAR